MYSLIERVAMEAAVVEAEITLSTGTNIRFRVVRVEKKTRPFETEQTFWLFYMCIWRYYKGLIIKVIF